MKELHSRHCGTSPARSVVLVKMRIAVAAGTVVVAQVRDEAVTVSPSGFLTWDGGNPGVFEGWDVGRDVFAVHAGS